MGKMKSGKAGLLLLSVIGLTAMLLLQGPAGQADGGTEEAQGALDRSFGVRLETGRQASAGVGAYIEGFLNEKDGKYYLFLPSAADTAQMRLCLEGMDGLYLDGEARKDGDKIILAPGEYSLGLEERGTGGGAGVSLEERRLVVMQSSGLGSIFVETESGSLDYLMEDKENREGGQILALDEIAGVVYKGELDYMKGRGNSSWSPIKPAFKLKLSQKASLYGIGAAKDWNMVPNAEDPSMLRNAVMYTWADKAGLAYSPHFVMVDWYINGDYRGTYQLCESIEIDEQRVAIADLGKETEAVNQTENLAKFGRVSVTEDGTDIMRWYRIPKDPPDISGGYLLELEISDRYDEDEECCGFVTSRNQNVVLKRPKYVSKAQLQYISGLYCRMEDAIHSENGYNMETGLHYSDYIDVESFARKYLIEEISKNLDAASTSQYLYKPRNEESLKFFAGPVWDYDKSLGNGGVRDNIYFLNEPQDLYASIAPAKGSLWKGLYGQPDFNEEMRRIFREDFLAVLPEMNRYIESAGERLTDSAVMNACRWDVYPGAEGEQAIRGEYRAAVESVRVFMNERCEWLDDYWD